MELARDKAAVLGDVSLEYRLAQSLPLDLEAGTHAYAMHPISGLEDSAAF